MILTCAVVHVRISTVQYVIFTEHIAPKTTYQDAKERTSKEMNGMERELWLSKLIEIEYLSFPEKYSSWLKYAIFCKYGFILSDEQEQTLKDGAKGFKVTVYGRYDSSDPNILPRKHGMENWLESFGDIVMEEIY